MFYNSRDLSNVIKQNVEFAFSEPCSLKVKRWRRPPRQRAFQPSLSSLCLRAPYDAVTNLKPGAAGGQQTSEYSNVMLYGHSLSNSMNEGGNWLPRKPSSPGNYYCN